MACEVDNHILRRADAKQYKQSNDGNSMTAGARAVREPLLVTGDIKLGPLPEQDKVNRYHAEEWKALGVIMAEDNDVCVFYFFIWCVCVCFFLPNRILTGFNKSRSPVF